MSDDVLTGVDSETGPFSSCCCCSLPGGKDQGSYARKKDLRFIHRLRHNSEAGFSSEKIRFGSRTRRLFLFVHMTA